MTLVSHLEGIVLFLSILLLISVSNLFTLRRPKTGKEKKDLAFASILVPARNEEANIETCVRSLLAQDYPNFEVLIYDDQSTDQTLPILQKIARDDSRLTILQGTNLPGGWLGKPWACQQLAEASQGEFLLLTDADTCHTPVSLKAGVQTLLRTDSSLVSALPRQQISSLGEQLTVPILYWCIFTFLPLGLAHRLQNPALSAAIGQYMLFRRSAYFSCGGHAEVRGNTADDLALARAVIRNGLHWRLVDGGHFVACRMYRSFGQAWRGISKSLFAAFQYRAWLFLPVWLWLAIVFIEPATLLGLSLTGFTLTESILCLAFIAVFLSLALWTVFALRFRYPVWLVIFYPLVIGISITLALYSWFLSLTGRAMWKERRLQDFLEK